MSGDMATLTGTLFPLFSTCQYSPNTIIDSELPYSLQITNSSIQMIPDISSYFFNLVHLTSFSSYLVVPATMRPRFSRSFEEVPPSLCLG